MRRWTRDEGALHRGRALACLVGLVLCFSSAVAAAQVRILPLGDSITHGGQGHASYRYALWDSLAAAGRDVDFVGGQQTVFGGDPPTLAWYPQYLTVFDRDHEGHWGWRTDQIAGIAASVAQATQPDLVLMHLGTNDIGQQGAAGISNADTWLRATIGGIRAVRPSATFLLARVIPIGPGTSYFANASHVPGLHAVVADIAADSTRPGSPVLVVDPHAGYEVGTMMQPDGLHPDTTGERHIARAWLTALLPLLPPGNPPPSASLTEPADGAAYAAGTAVALRATASDPNGSVIRVRFYVDSSLVATDESVPYEATWIAVLGSHAVEAEAEDDLGARRRSPIARITGVAPGEGLPVAIPGASFEAPALADGQLASGPGVLDGWTFSGTASTYLGIFDPPAGSYPEAAGSGTPLGAHGENVAFLFNNGGPAEQVTLSRTLVDTLAAAAEYTLRVAIGRFLPGQPYAFSEYGGYSIDLLAGGVAIASQTDAITPTVGRFADAVLTVRSDEGLAATRVGQPLSLRFALAGDQAPRSTHFDHVRLTRRPLPLGVPVSASAGEAVLWPAPSHDHARLRFRMAQPGPFTCTLHDVSGRIVLRLAESRLEAGSHERTLRWTGPPGLYLARVQMGDRARTLRLVRIAER